jgi:hypothetical protein
MKPDPQQAELDRRATYSFSPEAENITLKAKLAEAERRLTIAVAGESWYQRCVAAEAKLAKVVAVLNESAADDRAVTEALKQAEAKVEQLRTKVRELEIAFDFQKKSGDRLLAEAEAKLAKAQAKVARLEQSWCARSEYDALKAKLARAVEALEEVLRVSGIADPAVRRHAYERALPALAAAKEEP